MNKTKENKNIDWIGQWYNVAKQRGGNVLNMFVKYDIIEDEYTSLIFSHEYMDGAGAFSFWLKKQGVKIDSLPKAKFKDKPSLLEIPKVILNGLLAKNNQQLLWKERNKDQENESAYLNYLFLNPNQTANLSDKLKKSKISLNSYIMNLMSSILLPKLMDSTNDYSGQWLFPVNMRGNVKVENPYGNQSSGVFIDWNKTKKPNDLHNQIKKKLINKEHWLNWWSLMSGKYLGKKFMINASLKSSKKNFYLGTFSNLGNWTLEPSSGVNPNEIILASPPGTSNYPISIALIIWNNRLTITLKIHPFILKDQKKVEHFTSLIKDALLNNSLY